MRSRNVLVCGCFELKDKATAAGWSGAECCKFAIPHYTGGGF